MYITEQKLAVKATQNAVAFNHYSPKKTKNPLFDDFMSQIQRLNQGLGPDKTITDIIASTVQPVNVLNMGANSTVYNMPNIEGYVLKVEKNASVSPQKIKGHKVEPLKDEFESRNFGQAVCKVTDGVWVLKRQYGVEHSVNNWPEVITYPCKLTLKHALVFLDKINKLSQKDQKAYRHYAESMQYLSQKGYKLDSLNPNNLLVAENSINPIDFFKMPKGKEAYYQNTYFDMVTSLLDCAMFSQYYTLLDKDDKKKLIESTREVVKKTKAAAKASGLSLSEDQYYLYLLKGDKYFGCKLPICGYRARYEHVKHALATENIQITEIN